MHTLSVWAPAADQVEVVLGGTRHPMTKTEYGWWNAAADGIVPGTDYSFSIDGGEPVPDPRSLWQPKGIHGPSRIVDHSAFAWTDETWQARPLGGAIIYELHVGTFTQEGTFRSAAERLDYLRDLGVTHIELMPVNEFSGKWGWGYDGVDLYAPHHAYGTPDDLKSLINACHQKGLAVLLDVVYNHLGPTGNYLNQFGSYFTDAYTTPWGPAVNLDHEGSDETRKFFVENALMWLQDYHFDGLRLDAVHAYYDKSAIHFLEQLTCEVETLSSQLGRHLVLIAESDLNDPRYVRSREAGGYGLDAQWSDDFHHALHSVLTGERNGYYEDFGSYADLAKAIRGAFVFDGTYSTHRKRPHGRPIIGLSGHHFLAYSQTHDQVGNRAEGDRLSHLVSIGKQKIAAALVFTSPFVPMLFQGEEFAASAPFQYFTHHDDHELGQKVSDGRKSEFKAFGWEPEDVPDPQHPDTFQRSKLNWDEIDAEPHASMLSWYKQLIRLRRSSKTLSNGCMEDVSVIFDEGAQWMRIKRGDTQIVCNFGSDHFAVPITGKPKLMICSEAQYQQRPGLLELPPESVAILRD